MVYALLTSINFCLFSLFLFFLFLALYLCFFHSHIYSVRFLQTRCFALKRMCRWLSQGRVENHVIANCAMPKWHDISECLAPAIHHVHCGLSSHHPSALWGNFTNSYWRQDSMRDNWSIKVSWWYTSKA